MVQCQALGHMKICLVNGRVLGLVRIGSGNPGQNPWQNGGDRMGPRASDFIEQLDDFMGQDWDDSMSGSWSNEDWSGSWTACQ